MEKVAALMLLSGGIDSAACAHLLKSQGHHVEGLFLDYGQGPVNREKAAAATLASYLGISLVCGAVSGAPRHGPGEIVGRNAFLVFSAVVLKPWTAGIIALGIHGGTPYYDCSKAFVNRMATIVSEHTDGRLVLVAPFIDWNKKQVYDYFLASKLPIDLTYSCEADLDKPCKMCASCRDRSALGC